MKNKLYQHFVRNKQQGHKSFAVLVDPDKVDAAKVEQLVKLATTSKVDYFLVGGSLLISNHLDECIQQFKALCDIPIILFPYPRKCSNLSKCSKELKNNSLANSL